jgi:hypothetical protein
MTFGKFDDLGSLAEYTTASFSRESLCLRDSVVFLIVEMRLKQKNHRDAETQRLTEDKR